MKHSLGRFKNWDKALIMALLLPLCIISLLPLWIMIINSFASDQSLSAVGFALWPQSFSLNAYRKIFSQPEFLFRSFGVTMFVTLVGTFLSLLITTMFSYAISRPGFRGRRFLSFFIYFTMLFNGGTLSYYIMVTRYLHLKNTVWILIFPLLVSPFYIMLMRTYFHGLPQALTEAARLDGAGEYRTLFSIVLPLSMPSISTVALFTLLGYWNDMYQALLFIDNQNLYPLQFLLYKLVANKNIIPQGGQYTGIVNSPISQRMALATLVILPVLFSFGFVQKYFVRGITLGSIKGD